MNPIEIAMICCIAAVEAVSIFVSGFLLGKTIGLKRGIDALDNVQRGIHSDFEALRQKLREGEE